MQGTFGTEDWILGNVQQYGYYRVNYDRGNWLKLVQQLKTEHKVNSSNQNTAAAFVVFSVVYHPQAAFKIVAANLAARLDIWVCYVVCMI